MNENRATVQASDGGQVNLQLTAANLKKVSRIRQRLRQLNHIFSLLRLQTWTHT